MVTENTITLINRGKRQIDIAVGVDPKTNQPLMKSIMPGKGAKLSVEQAKKLKRLFPQELQTMEDIVDEFEAVEATPAPTAILAPNDEGNGAPGDAKDPVENGHGGEQPGDEPSKTEKPKTGFFSRNKTA